MTDTIVEARTNGADARCRAQNGGRSKLESRELHFEIDARLSDNQGF